MHLFKSVLSQVITCSCPLIILQMDGICVEVMHGLHGCWSKWLSVLCVVPFTFCYLLVPTLFFQGEGMLPYFANFRLLAEFSTPCVNQRWFFEVLGYPKSSPPNMANGVAMAVVFFMVRIAVMPVYYSRMYAVYGTEAYYLVPWGGRVAWICSSICLDIMNIMWMHKIARGCYKVLRSARRSKAAVPQENGKMD